MANREIEAILKISAKMGNLRALNTLNAELRKVDGQIGKINRSQTVAYRASQLASSGIMAGYGQIARFAAPAAIAAFGVSSVRNFAEIERQLTRTGIKLGATRREMAELDSQTLSTANLYALPKQDVQELVDAYAETGAELKDVHADIGMLAKAQQGLGAGAVEVAATWDTARKNFGVMTKEGERFFDIVAKGGAVGKFEGADLARYLPDLMPTAAVQGFKGVDGTARLIGMLEAFRDFTGSSEKAANGLRDFIDKVSSPTVQKAFSKVGINLEKDLKAGLAAGEDFEQVMARLIRKATGGDATKLGKLFTEIDSRNFARFLLKQLDAMNEKITEVKTNSKGMIDANVNQVLGDAQAKLDRMDNSIGNLKKQTGSLLVSIGGATAAEFLAGQVGKEAENLDKMKADGASAGEIALQYAKWHSGVQSIQDLIGWAMGWDDGEAIKAHAKELGDRRRQMEAIYSLPNPVMRDSRGMPIHPPLPKPRPMSPSEMWASAPGWAAGRDLYRPATPTQTLVERDEAEMRSRYFPEKPMYDLSEAESRMAGAGRAFREEAARAANEIGEQGGSTFARMLDGLGARIGREAAQAFRAGVGTIDVRPRTGAGVTGDLGQMPPTGGPQ